MTQLKLERGILHVENLESYRYNISFNSSPDRTILINIDEADGRDESKAWERKGKDKRQGFLGVQRIILHWNLYQQGWGCIVNLSDPSGVSLVRQLIGRLRTYLGPSWLNVEWGLTLRRLMTYIYIYIYIYIYGAPILDVSRSHTTTQHSR